MKKNWNDPRILDLAIECTEAQKVPNGVHDGVIYEADGWKDGVEGHS